MGKKRAKDPNASNLIATVTFKYTAADKATGKAFTREEIYTLPGKRFLVSHDYGLRYFRNIFLSDHPQLVLKDVLDLKYVLARVKPCSACTGDRQKQRTCSACDGNGVTHEILRSVTAEDDEQE